MKETDKIFDGLLVLRYTSGDKAALNLLVKRHHLRLCNHAYWYLKDAATAQDIVQDSWNVILTKIDSLKNPNEFRAWATKIVRRKSLDCIKLNNKKRQQLKEYDANSMLSETTGNTFFETELLRKAIRQLPMDQ